MRCLEVGGEEEGGEAVSVIDEGRVGGGSSGVGGSLEGFDGVESRLPEGGGGDESEGTGGAVVVEGGEAGGGRAAAATEAITAVVVVVVVMTMKGTMVMMILVMCDEGKR